MSLVDFLRRETRKDSVRRLQRARRLSRSRATPASSSASAARPAPESVGIGGGGGVGETVRQHESLALDSLLPFPSASKETFPVLQSVIPAVPASTVAWTLMVTVPQTGVAPFQVTGL